MIDFTLTREDSDMMFAIAARAERMRISYKPDRMRLIMDLSAAHRNGCPLDLLHLFTAPDYDFAHDVCGITRHIDRTTGKLTDCFVPRYAVQQ